MTDEAFLFSCFSNDFVQLVYPQSVFLRMRLTTREPIFFQFLLDISKNIYLKNIYIS